MSRRASHASRAAVSGLIGPAPSSIGGSSSLRCTISVVGLRRDPPSAAVAALPRERHERVRGGLLPLEDRAALLVEGALGLGEAADGLLERGAVLERQLSAEDELASSVPPGHTQRPARIQRLVVGDRRRHDRARRKRNPARRLADRDARDLGIARGRRERRRGRDLIERQVAVAEGLVERRQLAQRLGGLGQAARAAVVAARDLRQPLRKRRAPRRPPIPPSSARREISVSRWSSCACCSRIASTSSTTAAHSRS